MKMFAVHGLIIFFSETIMIGVDHSISCTCIVFPTHKYLFLTFLHTFVRNSYRAFCFVIQRLSKMPHMVSV